jgi:SAM-dependent methyltransferase
MKDWTTEIPRMMERAKTTKTLHMCCGRAKYEGSVGIDNNPDTAADVTHDLNIFPYPFPDGEFDTVICINGMEHLSDIVKVMGEIHRICRPGARVFIGTNHFSDAGSYIDPTHIHHLSARSFDYFIEGTALCAQYGYYSKCRYKLIDRRLGLHRLFRFLEGPVNRHIAFYEEALCCIIRGRSVYLELEAVK